MNSSTSHADFNIKKSILRTALFLLFPVFIHADAPPVKLPVLICPNDITIEAEFGECGIYIDYTGFSWSNSTTVVDTVFSPPQGYFFDLGLTPVTLVVIDINGNVDACTFYVTVVEYKEGAPSCKDTVYVNVGMPCEFELFTFVVANPAQTGCPSNLSVDILSPSGQSLGNMINSSMAGQTWVYELTNNYTGLSCQGKIIVQGNNLPPSIACPADKTVFCNQPADTSLTGTPLITGCFDETQLTIVHSDIQNNSFCDGNNIAFTIKRTWKATDPIGNMTSCVQNITAQRISLPNIMFPPNYDDSDLPPIQCSEELTFEMLTDTSITGVPTVNGISPASLACGIAVSFTDNVNHICGSFYKLQREWTVFDLCKSEFIKSIQTIIVEDLAAPEFTIPDTIWVSTSSQCSSQTLLPPIILLHECSGISVIIQTPFGTVNGNGGNLTVPQTPASYTISYFVSDDCGNEAEKSAKLVVTNALIAKCPKDQEISCNYFFDNLKEPLEMGDLSVLQEFGPPVTPANCNYPVTENATWEVNACGAGSIVRAFKIETPGQTVNCSQTIEVKHVSDFEVQFPADTLAVCETMPIETGEPELFFNDCENIEVTFTDEIVPATPDVCHQFIRHWVVINHCNVGDDVGDELPDPEVSPGRFADGGDGYIAFDQLVKVKDNVAPLFANGCSVPDACFTGSSCMGTVMIGMPEVLECIDYTMTASGQLGAGFGPFEDVLPGPYQVTYTAIDICGNQSSCNTTVNVVDCEPPVAVCKNMIIIELLNVIPAVSQVWANDLNLNSTDNCPGNLKYSWSPDVNDVMRTYDCYSIGLHLVQLWVTDQSGNQSFCETSLFIQPPVPNSVCEEEYIAGKIATETSKGVNLVKVSLSSGAMTTTNTSGNYELPTPAVPLVTITPFKNIYPLNGVTTFDLVLLTMHVLGTQLLNTPYKIIAADANKSGTVTTADAVEIRKLILQIIPNFTGNTSWRFVDKTYQFTMPMVMIPNFPESITVDLPLTGTENLDFIGIKIGDLNGSVIPSQFTGNTSDRSAGTVQFSVPDFNLKKGETCTLAFQPDSRPIYGYQFGLSFDPYSIELVDILPGFADASNFGLTEISKGIIRTSWNNSTPYTPQPGQPAFSLVFRAKNDGTLRGNLRLATLSMLAEAYSNDLEALDVELAFTEDPAADPHFKLYPNRPNPFRDATVIGFYMPEGDDIDFTVIDPAGRRVKQLQGYYAKGYHEIEVKGEDLPSQGLFFYRIKSKQGTGTGKMIVE